MVFQCFIVNFDDFDSNIFQSRWTFCRSFINNTNQTSTYVDTKLWNKHIWDIFGSNRYPIMRICIDCTWNFFSWRCIPSNNNNRLKSAFSHQFQSLPYRFAALIAFLLRASIVRRPSLKAKWKDKKKNEKRKN